MPRPWFIAKPDADGRWGDGKVDGTSFSGSNGPSAATRWRLRRRCASAMLKWSCPALDTTVARSTCRRTKWQRHARRRGIEHGSVCRHGAAEHLGRTGSVVRLCVGAGDSYQGERGGNNLLDLASAYADGEISVIAKLSTTASKISLSVKVDAGDNDHRPARR